MHTRHVFANFKRLATTPGMPQAYCQWVWSALRTSDGPALRRGGASLRGWISFSEFWWHRHQGTPAAEVRLMRRCRVQAPGQRAVAMDVGAHVGLYTAELAGCGYAEIHSFEPVRETFARLEANIRANRFPQSKIVLNRLALAVQPGSLAFAVDAASPATTHLLGEGERAPEGSREQVVAATSIDEYCREAGLARIDFLKVDAEGMEPLVFRGAAESLRRKRIAAILLEVFPAALARAGSSAAELVDSLRSCGYRVCRLSAAGEAGANLQLAELLRIGSENVVAVPE